MNTSYAVALVLLVLLLGAGFAFDGGDAGSAGRARPRAAAVEKAAPVGTIAARVERIRGLRFETPPRPVEVTPAQAQRDGLEDLDRSYPAPERHADEEVLKLLGLLQPSVDLRKVSATVFGQGVAGYYDPRTKRLRIVKGAQTTNRFLEEITLAHELTHALEDQRFGLHLDDTSGSDDAALARLALVEGSATAVMLTYGERHFSADQSLGGLFAGLGQDTGDLPPFVEAQLLFPYLAGQAFVQRLYAAGADSWKVLNAADRFRPPASTEQILHPDSYLAVEQPLRVRLDVRGVLGQGGWRRARAGTWGEWATGRLLGNPAPAEGWGGDRYELWQQGAGTCQAPCRQRDALVMRWRWDTSGDARDFVTALREWLPREPGPSAVATSGRDVTLALAPDAGLARRLARG
ncbi:MAG: hypothetical protein ABI611_21410 [Solirubrobacteraceae bacterium]